MTIHITTTETKGKAIALDGEQQAGEMTYSIPGTDFIIIDHTAVDERYRGQKVGQQLLDKLVAMARDNQLQILPLCPFAKAMFAKNKDIQDVLK